MKIALPLTATDGFADHYGAAVQFMVYEVDPPTGTVRRRLQVQPVENQPCHWPVLLRAAGAELVLAGGMGGRPRQHMAEHGITVLAGVLPAAPEALVAAWMAGTLVIGENACAGGHHDGDGDCHGHGQENEEGHGHEHHCRCSH